MAFAKYGTTARLFCRIALANIRPSRKYSLQQRLAMLPLNDAPLARPVEIFWNTHQVPFIEAETDDDLATALGIVHGHLRLGQIEFMRRIAQGRVSELVGGFGIGVDRLIRAIDIGRAVPGIMAALPPETRCWLEHFARGLNHCLTASPERPREFALLGLQPEPWTAADLVQLGRLVAADVNWIVWLRLLKHRGAPHWPQFWRRLLRHDVLSFESAHEPARPHLAPEILTAAGMRSGSNSFVVTASRSESGGALIANDPHLPIMMPNVWLLAGMKSPSHNAVGLMVPGVPFIALGRSPWMAWGGASLHAASSDLVRVPDNARLRERIETIRVRGESNVSFRIRESEWGPVVSDLAEFRSDGDMLALRWVGHQPSDEFTAMLQAGRAKNWDEVRSAFSTYAVPGLEMNFADISGHIGQLTTAKLPNRKMQEPDDVISSPENGWDDLIDVVRLPCSFDPPEGFLASANARPNDQTHVIAFHYSPPDRVTRLRHLLGGTEKFSLARFQQLQRDVHLEEAVRQRDQLLVWLGKRARGIAAVRNLLSVLTEWDGNYDAGSKGALAFELLFFHFAKQIVPESHHRAYDAVWGTRALIWEDVLNAGPSKRHYAVEHALRLAARDFRRYKNWGALHRLRLAHPFGQIPLAGRRARFADLPADGTAETLMKTAHGLTNRRHYASYGSVARHISDLSHPDANYFALLGGQDGWFGSDTAVDQVALWTSGEYIQLPMLADSVRKIFSHRTTLKPAT